MQDLYSNFCSIFSNGTNYLFQSAILLLLWKKNSIWGNVIALADFFFFIETVYFSGFADIPSGKVSPYILRRTTLHLRSSPHLTSSSEKTPLPTQDTQKCRPDHLGERCCLTPGGSKPQKVTWKNFIWVWKSWGRLNAFTEYIHLSK